MMAAAQNLHQNEFPEPCPQPCVRGIESNWPQQLSQLNQQAIVAADRLHWMQVMREKLFGDGQGGELADLDDDSIAQPMIELAERLCDWPMAVYLREQIDPQVAQTDFAIDNKSGLAEAYHQQGLLAEAGQCIRSCLLTHYQQPRLAQYYWQLQRELSDGPFTPEDLQAGSLMLTPMTEYHLSSFCWVYADPQIGELCNLPDFDNDQHWLHWLAEAQTEPNKTLFVVVHREWGLIGSVSLEVYGGVGFFYYWLGADFQGHGFGPQAVALLLNAGANCLGLRCCYAKVFDHNTPSQKAMRKLGFRLLPFAVAAPYDDERVYYLGPDKAEQVLFAELEQLFVAQDSCLRLVGTITR
jgi:RimJ/RimL family protein N-acetyltransferase